MFGKTPPSAMVVLANNLFNYSSFLMANKMCLGTILVFLLSLAAFPANSRTSAAKYSRTAARQTGAPAPTLSVQWACLRSLPTLPTGNCNPALDDFETAFDDVVLAFPLFPPFPAISLVLLIIIKISINEKQKENIIPDCMNNPIKIKSINVKYPFKLNIKLIIKCLSLFENLE